MTNASLAAPNSTAMKDTTMNRHFNHFAATAIKTSYAGATNYKGARIIATTTRPVGSDRPSRVVIGYDYGLDEFGNHAAAAQALAAKLQWEGQWIAGNTHDSGYHFVRLVPRGDFAFVIPNGEA